MNPRGIYIEINRRIPGEKEEALTVMVERSREGKGREGKGRGNKNE